MRFGASRETRALRPPQMVLPKKLDLRRPLPQSLQAKTCGSRFRAEILRSMIRGWIACSVRQERAFLRERGFANAHLAA